MQQGNEDLRDLRAQIDTIDDEMLRLLKQRAHIVHQVGERKRKNAQTELSFIRPAREAQMVRHLTQKIGQDFPPVIIASLWRLIISASLALEKPMEILSFHTEQQPHCYWLARDYFGVVMKTERHKNSETIIQKVARTPTIIGVLPLLDDAENPWWLRPSTEKNHIYIFACLPFVRTEWMKDEPAFAIANVMPEPTDEDHSVIAIKTKQPEGEILAQLASQFSAPRILARSTVGLLVEVQGFLPTTTQIEISGDADCRLLGAYAAPLKF